MIWPCPMRPAWTTGGRSAFLGDADGGESERRRGGSFVDLAFGEGIGAMTDESDFGDGAVERVQFFRR